MADEPQCNEGTPESTDDPQFNANCPYCGEETLVATVQAVNSNVPLGPTDYDFDEGTPDDTEILQITCTSCGREDIVRNHYFDHGPDGDPCDCNEPITITFPEVSPDQADRVLRLRDHLQQGFDAAGFPERDNEEDQNDG